MSCKNCHKNIIGNFICFNIGGGLLDKTKTSVDIPKNLTLDVWFYIRSHSDKKLKYKSKNIFKKMKGNWWWGSQMEEYFCSKECLLKWFENQIKNIPNP